MISHVYATGNQLRWAADLSPGEVPRAADIVLAGLGGSGMAARVGALTAPSIPLTLVQGYELPGWAPGRKPLVVAVSYSGNTEETLAVFEAARAAGLPLVAVTTGGALAELAAAVGAAVVEVPGGLQPRAALAYQAGAVTMVLAAATGAASPASELTAAADVVDRTLDDGDGPGAALGRDLAEGIHGRICVIYGGHGVGAVAASRWKAQINENAKMPAFASEVPELDHNELEGWGTLPDLGRRTIALVTLRDPAGHPRIEQRMRLTTEVVRGKVAHVGEVIALGTSPLSRFFSLAAVGDVASVELARLSDVDPTPVTLLEDFKRRLRED